MFEPAPLVDTPEAPVPDRAEAEWYLGAGGTKLRAALFRPDGPARGSVVLSGGRTEPIEKYFETIGDFTSRGFVVLAHDWRGQGLSARLIRTVRSAGRSSLLTVAPSRWMKPSPFRSSFTVRDSPSPEAAARRIRSVSSSRVAMPQPRS